MDSKYKFDQYTLDRGLCTLQQKWNTWKFWRKPTKHRTVMFSKHVIFWLINFLHWSNSTKRHWMRESHHRQFGNHKNIVILKENSLNYFKVVTPKLVISEKYRYWRNWNTGISFNFRIFLWVRRQLHWFLNMCPWIWRRTFCVCHEILFFHNLLCKVTCIKL